MLIQGRRAHGNQPIAFKMGGDLNGVAVISAKNHKRQRRKRQSVTAKRENRKRQGF